METGEFGRRLLDLATGHALTTLIGNGHRTGLFETVARGPATSAELAKRAGLDERYVREWLGAVVPGGILTHDAGRYALPAAHAPLLTGTRASNVGPTAGMLARLAALAPQVERCFVDGGGVAYAEYAALGPMGEQWRHIYDEHLVSGFLAAVPGLDARLRSGARVLDLGCGSGHAVNLMAREYPVRGDRARPRTGGDRRGRGGTRGDGARERPLRGGRRRSPEARVRRDHRVRRRARPAGPGDGAASRPGGAGPGRRVRHGGRRLRLRPRRQRRQPARATGLRDQPAVCVPTSQAAGGPGLGAMWGRGAALAMLADAGFADVTVLPSPRAQNCIYVGRT